MATSKVDRAAATSGGNEESGGMGGGEKSSQAAAEKTEILFECKICLDTAQDPVVSKCGHLFCWPCLYQWLETRLSGKVCPVCKAAISQDNVVPLYGSGTESKDRHDKVPPRPRGQRAEPETLRQLDRFGFEVEDMLSDLDVFTQRLDSVN